ncbi:uncharacterized protein LOC108621965 [Ceratina calcarata]|uniref:Uncharacterized protein LOC108621965 n=1 Tax=Ceratina calcarata TaxID=156304 RepID=A0AAJ7N3H4_9HYME|nr:uncharacterized protein LOC108621965 [Ceratina calcarata]
MKWKKLLYALALSVLLVSFCRFAESKKVIIHVPYRVKNVKHVHTIYKIIPHYHEEKEEEIEEEIEEDDKYGSY